MKSSIRLKVFGIILISFIGVMIFQSSVMGETGVTDDTIKLGAVMMLSGPAAHIGHDYRAGVMSYLNSINESGGIHGRKIKLLIEDDNYKPMKALSASKKLVERNHIFAMTFSVGTPTVAAALPYLMSKKVPLIMPGAMFRSLVDPPKKYVFGFMPDYHIQFQCLADYIVKKLGQKKVAFIYMNDETGVTARSGLEVGLAQYGLKLKAALPFERGVHDFSSQVLKARKSGAEHVAMMAITTDAALILRQADMLGWHPQFSGHMTLGDPKLVELAGSLTDGFITIGLTRFAAEETHAVREMVTLLKKYYPKTRPAVFPMIGFASAKILVEALRRVGRDITREKLITTLESIKNFGTGLTAPVFYSPTNRVGLTGIRIQQFNKGKLAPVSDWITLKNE